MEINTHKTVNRRFEISIYVLQFNIHNSGWYRRDNVFVLVAIWLNPRPYSTFIIMLLRYRDGEKVVDA